MDGNGTPVRIRHFTDPSCPFAFSAERQRLRLEWLYGDQIDWTTHLVVLAEEPNPGLHAGAGGAGPQAAASALRDADGVEPGRRAVVAGLPACRAVVAARRARRRPLWRAAAPAPGAVLRGLRLDDPDVIARAATEAGLDPAELERWTGEPEAEAALRADMRAARSPSPASRAQDYKLGGPPEERRYTCPSYELERTDAGARGLADGRARRPPGYRPVEAYETAIANLAPELERRPDPESVEEVLAWARMPLATAEVAMVADRDLDDVREELSRVAAFDPVGGDGYWARTLTY